MSLPRYALALVLAVAAAGSFVLFPEGNDAEAEAPFDFWVLALSWSPSFCAEADNAAAQNQCRQRRAFIVHGLWPQYERGYPEFCSTTMPAPGRDDLARIADLIPDAGLARHEWDRHGSCSGLEPAGYFAATRRAFDQVRIPESFRDADRDRRTDPAEIERTFLAANPELAEDGMSVACTGGRFTELRICLTPDFRFRSCREVDSRGCPARTLTVPAAP